VGSDVVHGDDVRVRQTGHRLTLADEAGPACRGLSIAGIVGIRSKELHRELAIELGIVGGVDDAHAAFADLREDDVAAERRAAGERGPGGRGPGRQGGGEGGIGVWLRGLAQGFDRFRERGRGIGGQPREHIAGVT
jgi:hypothetical protein